METGVLCRDVDDLDALDMKRGICQNTLVRLPAEFPCLNKKWCEIVRLQKNKDDTFMTRFHGKL